ncbi:MAG: hypothetical protein RLZZ165_1950 [Bacteroidota bacterium]|jgi:DNA-binding transcriptional MerR regulator
MEEQENIQRKYHTISEVAEMLGVKPSLIRFWETEFTQLKPRKNRKGNRTYTEADIEMLKTIYYLVKERKYTLKGAQDKLRQNPKDLEHEQRTRATLLKVRGFLAELKEYL